MIWYVRSISLWLMLAIPLTNSAAIARNKALQDQLNIIAASESITQHKDANNDESRQQPTIEILEDSEAEEVVILEKRETSHKGILKVKIVRAKNLPGSDGWLNDPDPYACVVAVNQLNTRYKRCTTVISETKNPVWNQELDFGESCSGWKHYTITIYDEDIHRPDIMVQGPRSYLRPGKRWGSYCNSYGECLDYEINMDVYDDS